MEQPSSFSPILIPFFSASSDGDGIRVLRRHRRDERDERDAESRRQRDVTDDGDDDDAGVTPTSRDERVSDGPRQRRRDIAHLRR